MSGIFRDPTEGAKAKRLDLLRRRRDELVTLPHIVRRVFVSRAARIAASVAVCIGGLTLLAAAASPDLAEWLAGGLPGQRPAPLSTLLVSTWILGIATYAIARSVAEHRFAVHMSQYVLPGDDLNQDLERLSHEHPDDVAKRMAHRLEVKSAALPVLGAAVLLPVTLMYAYMALRDWGWPSPNGFEAGIADHSTTWIATAIVGLVASIAITRPSLRSSRGASVAAAFAAVLGSVTVIAYVEGAFGVTWMAMIPAFVAAAAAVIGRRLRSERKKIAAVDPAAGSELFTIRGFARKLRGAAAAINAALTLDNARRLARGAATALRRPPSVKAVLVSVALTAAVAYGALALLTDDPAAAKPRPHVTNGDGIGMQSAPTEPTTWSVEQGPAGQIAVEITLGDLAEIEIPSLAGIDEIPAGWELVVTVRAYDVEFDSDQESHAVFVTPVLDPIVTPRQLSSSLSSVDFVIDNCDGMLMPLGLRVRPYGDSWKPGDVIKLTVEPRLKVAACINPVDLE